MDVRLVRGLGAMALVIPSACERHLVASFFRLRPPRIPVEVFADEESAREWLDERELSATRAF